MEAAGAGWAFGPNCYSDFKTNQPKPKHLCGGKKGNNCFRVLPLFVHNYCTVTIDPGPGQETAVVVAFVK